MGLARTAITTLALGAMGIASTAWAETPEPVPPARIRTILETSCVSCHGAESQKAGLRLDAPEHIQKGGENGVVFAASNADGSSLVHRISLPEGDADLMPPKGGPLKAKDIEAIRNWVNQGASFEGWADAYTEPQLMYAAVSVGAGSGAALYADDVFTTLAEGVAPVAPEVLKPLEDAGIRVAPLDQKSPLLQADLKFVPEGAGDAHVAQLAAVAGNLTWINLAGSKVTDAGLSPLAAMPKLTALHLERTAITDAGLAHLAGLVNIEYLNLFGTQVTDAGLETLKGLPKLKRLYVWQTSVTPEGAKALGDANPQLVVNMGTEQKPLEQLVYNDPAEDLKKMEEGAAPAAAAPAEDEGFNPFAPAKPAA